MLGGLAGLLALAVRALDLSTATVLLLVAAGSLVAVASDGRLGGFQLPGHDRQVNERWLDQYRNWVYGAGFGWQIGVGLATYIMTGGLYLLILVAALGGSVTDALILGTVFGLIRGLAVFAAGGITNQGALNDFHRAFERWRQPVRKLTIAAIALVGIVAGLSAGSALGIGNCCSGDYRCRAGRPGRARNQLPAGQLTRSGLGAGSGRPDRSEKQPDGGEHQDQRSDPGNGAVAG